MTTINSKLIYTTVEQAYEAAKEQIKAANLTATSIYMTAWSGYGQPTHFKLEISCGYQKKAEVEGTDLQEMVEEVIHRLQFQARQETLLLAGPTVEASAAAAADDEIPF